METLEEIREADISVFIEGCEGLKAGSIITIFIIGAVVILALILAVGFLSFYCGRRGEIRGRKDSELANCRKTGGPEESPEPIYDCLDDVIENAAVTMAVLTEPHYVENIVVPEPGEPQYVENIVVPVLKPVTKAVLTEPHCVENTVPVDLEPGEPQYVENIVIVDTVLNPDYVGYNPAHGTAAGNRSYMNVELNYVNSVKPTDTSEYLEMNKL